LIPVDSDERVGFLVEGAARENECRREGNGQRRRRKGEGEGGIEGDSLLQRNHNELNSRRAVFPEVSSDPRDVGVVESGVHFVENEEGSGLEAGEEGGKKKNESASKSTRVPSRRS